MSQRKRIAFYGGTFDPVHNGHLEVARRTIELFEFSELVFVPARQAPHKLEREVTPPLHRYAMLALATQEDPQLRISTFELDAPDRRYTIDTLRHFRSLFRESQELFFIMGADSWSEITTWRDWYGLLQTVNVIVVTRPGYVIEAASDKPDNPVSFADVRGWQGERIARLFAEGTGPRVFVTDIAMVDVSATAVREMRRAGRDELLEELVPETVADYIKKYGLYKNSNEN